MSPLVALPADILLFAVPPVYEKNKVSVTPEVRICLMAPDQIGSGPSDPPPSAEDDISCSRTYPSAVSSLLDSSLDTEGILHPSLLSSAQLLKI